MIVRERDGSLLLFDQRDHSALCGQMARVWGAPPFQPVPDWVQRAAEIHDGGWPEWDRRPRLEQETGRPHNYSRMPANDYLEIWERGLARAWAQGEGTGLLVSLHATRFFARKERAQDRALLQRERERQTAALAALGWPGADAESLPEPVATWHAWMFFWDGLSLFVCEGWPSPWRSRVPSQTGLVAVSVERGTERAEDVVVHLRPFPFVETLQSVVHARVIAAEPYRSQRALDSAVQRAALLPLHLDIRPGSG